MAMRIYNTVLLSRGLVHPSLCARYQFANFLNKTALTIIPTNSLGFLSSPEARQADLWIFHFHLKHITPTLIHHMNTHLAKNGSILAIHSASASFKTCREYENILGGKFTSHGPITKFAILPAATKTGTFKHDAPFNLKDELYIHQFGSSCHIHYQTMINHVPEPILWTIDHSPGRVAYFSPGHLASTFRNLAVKSILLDTITWLMEEKR